MGSNKSSEDELKEIKEDDASLALSKKATISQRYEDCLGCAKYYKAINNKDKYIFWKKKSDKCLDKKEYKKNKKLEKKMEEEWEKRCVLCGEEMQYHDGWPDLHDFKERI